MASPTHAHARTRVVCTRPLGLLSHLRGPPPPPPSAPRPRPLPATQIAEEFAERRSRVEEEHSARLSVGEADAAPAPAPEPEPEPEPAPAAAPAAPAAPAATDAEPTTPAPPTEPPAAAPAATATPAPAPAASGGIGRAYTPEEEALEAELAKLSLAQFGAALIKEGLDSLETLRELTDQEVSTRPIHARPPAHTHTTLSSQAPPTPTYLLVAPHIDALLIQ